MREGGSTLWTVHHGLISTSWVLKDPNFMSFMSTMMIHWVHLFCPQGEHVSGLSNQISHLHRHGPPADGPLVGVCIMWWLVRSNSNVTACGRATTRRNCDRSANGHANIDTNLRHDVKFAHFLEWTLWVKPLMEHKMAISVPPCFLQKQFLTDCFMHPLIERVFFLWPWLIQIPPACANLSHPSWQHKCHPPWEWQNNLEPCSVAFLVHPSW